MKLLDNLQKTINKIQAGGARKRKTRRRKSHRRKKSHRRGKSHRRHTRCPPRRRRRRAFYKYSRSLTHPHEKDFTRKKGQKRFNRRGRYQTWNSRGRKSTPFATFH